MMYACPHRDCGAVSSNDHDAEESYCGRCHRYADDPVLIGELIVGELERLDELQRLRLAARIVADHAAELTR